MGIPTVTIPYLSVLIAAIAHMVLGMLWYSPAGFGKYWIKLIGFSEKDLKKAKDRGMGKYYFAAFVAALITALVLAYLVTLLTAVTFIAGIQVGIIAWLGFVAPIALNVVLWEAKPLKLYVLNISYYFVSLGIMGGLIAVM